jgi:hypothetical protein
MVQLARSTFLAAAVCAACLVATALAFQQATLNRATPVSWHVTSALTAAAVLVVAAFVARISGVLMLELAAAGVAGGLLANSLVSGSAGGVADFVRAGGWIYSPGDLAVLAGMALLAAGAACATLRVCSDR